VNEPPHGSGEPPAPDSDWGWEPVWDLEPVEAVTARMPALAGPGRARPPGARPGPDREALARRLGRLKAGALAVGIAGFGTLSGLAATHSTGVTSHRPPASPAATAQVPSTGFFEQDGSSGFVDPQAPAADALPAAAPPPPPVAVSSGS